MATRSDNPLGDCLRNHRSRLDPDAFGFPTQRRCTPRLRREEVAHRANITPTWYTWLEQGRDGAPSPDVLNRIAVGLMLSDAEREHLFMLALRRPPEIRFGASGGVRRASDGFSMRCRPARRSSRRRHGTWWRGTGPPWSSPMAASCQRASATSCAWCSATTAFADHRRIGKARFRFVVGAFRADNGVSFHGEGAKRLRHPDLGPIESEYSGFAVDGRPERGRAHPIVACGIRRAESMA